MSVRLYVTATPILRLCCLRYQVFAAPVGHTCPINNMKCYEVQSIRIVLRVTSLGYDVGLGLLHNDDVSFC